MLPNDVTAEEAAVCSFYIPSQATFSITYQSILASPHTSKACSSQETHLDTFSVVSSGDGPSHRQSM